MPRELSVAPRTLAKPAVSLFFFSFFLNVTSSLFDMREKLLFSVALTWGGWCFVCCHVHQLEKKKWQSPHC